MVRPITRKNPRKRAPPARKRGGETPWRVRVARLVKRSSTGAWDAVRALEASRRADLVVRQMYYVRSQLVVWFNTLDDNGDAFLSRDELAAGLAESFGVDASSAPYVAAEIIRRADDDDDGVLTLGELLGMVRRATEQYKLWRECRDALRKIGLSIFVYLPAVATAMALPLGLLMSWAEGWTYEKGFWVALAELCMTNIKIVRDNSPRGDAGTAAAGAGHESDIPNFKGSFLGRFPLVLADFWTSDHLSERSRSVDAISGTRARGTLKRRGISPFPPRFQDGVAAAAAELSGALPTYTASDGRPRKSPGRGSTPPALLQAWRASADRALEAFPAEALVDDSLESARDFLDEVKGNAPSAKELRAMYDAVVGAEAPAPPPRAAAAAIPLDAAPKKSYGAARVVALSLRFVTPLSFAILAAAVAAPALGLSVPVLEAWPLVALAAAETGFAGGRFLNLLRSRGDWVDDLDLDDDDALFSPSKAAPPPKLGYRVLWRRCLDACRDDVRGFVEGWFYDARLETLTRADVEAWIAGNVYGKEIKGDIDDRRARQLAWMVQLLEQRLGAELASPAFAFPPGPRSVEFMSAPSQPLERRLHPLLLYAALGAARRAYGLQLKAAGFAKKRAGRLSYWVRDGEALGDDDGFRPAPVVFAHGIGVGLLPYKDAIAKLAAGARSAGAATYLLELPAISTTLQGEELPRPVDLAADVSLALRSNGDAAAVFVGHSFGSAAMSYVLRHAPDVVAASVFVEPVVFLLNRPNVSNGFLFDKSPDPILDVLRSDPDIAFSMRRRFWWQEAVLWADQIRVPTDVFLSDFDKIVPGAAVRAYLADEADGRLVSVTSLGAKTHGEWQYDEASQDAVVAAALARRAAVDDARRRNALGAYLEALLRSRTRAPTGR